MRIALVLAALGALTAEAPASAAPACKPSQRYEGPRLHVPPVAEDFPGPAPLQLAAMDPVRVAKLNDVMDAFAKTANPPGFTAAIVTEAGETWSAQRSNSAERPRMFYWASAGKALTALAILQLAEEGKLSLSDHIDRWAPDFPNAKLITIDQLLNHTSGLYSFQNDEALRTRPGYKSPDDLLAVARSHDADFCPGRTWAYSNTGYVLLGKIVEAADKRPFADALKARIVDRLGLPDTRILGPDASLDGIAALKPVTADGANDDVRTPGAAGPVVASAQDMARIWQASLSGELLPTQATRDRFAALYPMFGNAAQVYGRGVMLYDVPASDRTPADTWLGHSGGLPGAKAVIVWSLTRRAIVTVAIMGDAPAEALANRLLTVLD